MPDLTELRPRCSYHINNLQKYKKAQSRYDSIKRHYTVAEQTTPKGELQNHPAYKAWFGKPWNELTEHEKSHHYKEFTDPYSINTWESLPFYEKYKYNAENKNLYQGQCRNFCKLERTKEELTQQNSLLLLELQTAQAQMEGYADRDINFVQRAIKRLNTITLT